MSRGGLVLVLSFVWSTGAGASPERQRQIAGARALSVFAEMGGADPSYARARQALGVAAKQVRPRATRYLWRFWKETADDRIEILAAQFVGAFATFREDGTAEARARAIKLIVEAYLTAGVTTGARGSLVPVFSLFAGLNIAGLIYAAHVASPQEFMANLPIFFAFAFASGSLALVLNMSENFDRRFSDLPHLPRASADRLIKKFWTTVETRIPTDQLTPGVPGLSYGQRIARHLAPTAVELTGACEALLSSSKRSFLGQRP